MNVLRGGRLPRGRLGPARSAVHPGPPPPPLALTDAQLTMIMTAASALSPDKRTVLLERVAGQLRGCSGAPSDSDLARVLEKALRGLVHSAADA